MEKAAAAGSDGTRLHWNLVNLVQKIEVAERVDVLPQMLPKELHTVLIQGSTIFGDPGSDFFLDARRC